MALVLPSSKNHIISSTAQRRDRSAAQAFVARQPGASRGMRGPWSSWFWGLHASSGWSRMNQGPSAMPCRGDTVHISWCLLLLGFEGLGQSRMAARASLPLHCRGCLGADCWSQNAPKSQHCSMVSEVFGQCVPFSPTVITCTRPHEQHVMSCHCFVTDVFLQQQHANQ